MSALLLGCALVAHAQDFNVTAQIEIVSEGQARTNKKDRSNVVVWLNPLDDHALRAVSDAVPAQPTRLVQKDKKFIPHLLVVPAGTAVEFPNHDPFFHNVFSLFEGKRFDLGLYEAGTTRLVRFDRVGISYIFCNIHPEMNAVVVALKTPYYGVSNVAGRISIAHVPAGRYTMQVWAEAAGIQTLKTLARTITVSEQNQSLGVIRQWQTARPLPTRTNMDATTTLRAATTQRTSRNRRNGFRS